MEKVLIIDDDKSFREVMRFHLEEEGIEVDVAKDGKEGLETFNPASHQVVVTDLKMPGVDGMEVLSKIKKISASTVVLVITAFGTIEKAVDAMKSGAFDFIPKPCTRDHFNLTVKKAIEHQRLHARVKELEQVVSTGNREIIYKSQAMLKAVAFADRVAQSNASVLITGESGTGKELFAQRLHLKSGRIDCPFVVVNCGAIPFDLIESELFGHVKGAFTGALKNRKGKFELANRGTIFLDEIAEIPIQTQPKLLRVLSEDVMDVIGLEKAVSVDVRVVAATNKDLSQEIKKERFRQDLFFRINVVNIEIPPLRRRKEDIPLLTSYFLKRYSTSKALSLTEKAQAVISNHPWPGNVRELENFCRRIALLAEDDVIDKEDLPLFHSELAAESEIIEGDIVLPDKGLSLLDLEKKVIIKALSKNEYNQTRTARYLDIPRHVLLYRIKKYGIDILKRS